MAGEFAEKEPQILSYSDFKRIGAIEEGAIIERVKPMSLYTTQDWISVRKVSDALGREVETTGKYPVSAYIQEREKGRILVLGDGNTRAIVAWIRGVPVDVIVKGFLPKDQRCISLSLLKRRYRDLFVGFEYG